MAHKVKMLDAELEAVADRELKRGSSRCEMCGHAVVPTIASMVKTHARDAAIFSVCLSTGQVGLGQSPHIPTALAEAIRDALKAVPICPKGGAHGNCC
jgi:hypothetical protein